MTHTVEADAPASADRQADAFGPVTLATFAQNPTGAHLFRAQHEFLNQLMAKVVRQSEGDADGESIMLARIALTSLTSLLPIHQSLEEALIHRALSGEPRSRMVAEQFEREMVPLAAEVSALARRFPTASSIQAQPAGEFAATASGLFSRIEERFRREERDLFPIFDRVANSASSNT